MYQIESIRDAASVQVGRLRATYRPSKRMMRAVAGRGMSEGMGSLREWEKLAAW